jgi:hypothetical protein
MVIALALGEEVVVELLLDVEDDDVPRYHYFEQVHILVVDDLLLELILHDFHADAMLVDAHAAMFEQLELNDECFLVVVEEVNEVKFVQFDHIVGMEVAKAI